MHALEVMNGFVVRAKATSLVKDVAQSMRDQGVGIVSICDEEQRPVGVVTDRDITVRVCAAGTPPETTAVQAIMTKKPVTCDVNTPVEEIHRLMNAHGIGRVLVVDEEGRLAGVVTLAELWHYESPLTAGPVSRRVTERELRVHGTGGGHALDGGAVVSAPATDSGG